VRSRALAIILWMLSPTYQMRRELQALVPGRGRFSPLWAAPRTLLRLALVGLFVWTVASRHWHGAAFVGGLLVSLGLLSWASWVAGIWIAGRLGRLK
jgi:hypothetical protein